MKSLKKLLIWTVGIALVAGFAGEYLKSKVFEHQSATETVVSHPAKSISSGNISYDLSSIANKTYYRNRVVIVTFHDISPNTYSPYVITPAEFSADLDAIQARFNVITNQQFIDFLNHRGQLPQNAVLLTFDDGYRSMYTYALPALLGHHMQGTFFEIVGTADENRPENLTWDQMKTMVKDGMVFASHTYNSHYEVPGLTGIMEPVFDTRMSKNGTRETLNQFNQRVYADFLKARLELQAQIGEPVIQFAWPFGWGIPESTYLAKRVGYEYIYTTTDGCVTANTNVIAIPRIDIGKPWISPLKALQMIIHFSRVIPNTIQIGGHHATEVSVVVHPHKGTTSSANGKGKKSSSTGGKQQGTHGGTTNGTGNKSTGSGQNSTGQSKGSNSTQTQQGGTTTTNNTTSTNSTGK